MHSLPVFIDLNNSKISNHQRQLLFGALSKAGFNA